MDYDAVVKLLWLAIINIEDKRARERLALRQATGIGYTLEFTGSFPVVSWWWCWLGGC